jgi:hypothetical protein
MAAPVPEIMDDSFYLLLRLFNNESRLKFYLYVLDSAALGWGPVVVCCEHGNLLQGSINGRKFLTGCAISPTKKCTYSMK